MWGDIAIAFTIAFLAAFMATPHTIKLAKRLGAVDNPKDDRRINEVTMPRLGGLAVILGFIISVIYLLIVMTLENKIDLSAENYNFKLLGFAAGGLIIAIVCFIDDIKGLPALSKLLAQIIKDFMANEIFSTILTIGWIVGITNAINLIDGLDGLSTGISLIACISLLIIFSLNGSPLVSIILITALAGTLCGFLPYNYNPARTFIGDVGSNFIGYCLSIISILGIAKTYTAIVIIAPLIVLALPVFDTLMAIIRRVIKGKSLKAIVTPDANHLHHKMLKMGFTQKQAVLILYAITAMLGIFAIILMDGGLIKALSFALMILVIIAMGYKEFFKQRLLENWNDEYKKD